MASSNDSPQESDRPPVRRWVIAGGILLILLVLAALLVQSLLGFDWTFLRELGPSYLLVILLTLVISTALQTIAVQMLVRGGGYRASFVHAYLVLTSSLSVNYVTPVKVGIPLRIYLYKQVLQVPLGIGTALVALETWLGMLIPAVIATVGIAVLFPEIGLAAPLALLTALLVGMGAMLFVKPSLVSPLLGRLPLQKFTSRLVHFGETVQAGFRSVPPWRLGVVGLLFGLNFAVATTRLYFVLLMLGWPVSWPALLAVLTISITAGNLSMIPMGLGVRDASLTLLLTRLGAPNEIALSTAVIQRLLSPGWPLLLGLISTNILGLSEMMKRSDDVPATQEEA